MCRDVFINFPSHGHRKQRCALRAIALALCVCFMFVSVLASAFVFTHAQHVHDHNGIGGACVTCVQLAAARDFGKLFVIALLTAAWLIVALFGTLPLQNSIPQAAASTPVSRKVRLNQ